MFGGGKGHPTLTIMQFDKRYKLEGECSVSTGICWWHRPVIADEVVGGGVVLVSGRRNQEIVQHVSGGYFF